MDVCCVNSTVEAARKSVTKLIQKRAGWVWTIWQTYSMKANAEGHQSTRGVDNGPPLYSCTVASSGRLLATPLLPAPSHHSPWCKELLLAIVFLGLWPWPIPVYKKTFSLRVSLLLPPQTQLFPYSVVHREYRSGLSSWCVYILILLFQERD